MSRRNPYAMDPALMQGVSNLTRALIGSAADDASLARGRASDALAGKLGAETAYQEGQTNYLEENNAAIADALSDSRLVSSLFGATGLNSGNLPTNPTGRTGPFIGNDPATSMQPGVSENAMRGLARSMFFGGVPGNPQQSAASAQTLANMNNQQAAYNLLSESGQSPDRQAAIRLGQNLGQYFDSGVAQTGLANTLTAAMDKNAKGLAGTKFTSNNTLQGTNNKTAAQFGAGGQGDRDTDANNVAAAREDDLRFGVGGQGDRNATSAATSRVDVANIGATVNREKNAMDDKTTRWKHDNRTISMSVEPGKQIVLDAQTGRMLGIEPTMVTDGGETKEIYVLDGGPALGKIKVSVPEGGTVFMDRKTAEAIGVKQDENGQWKVKGPPKTSTSSGNNATMKVSTTEAKKYQELAVQSLDNSIGDDYGDFINGQGIIDHVVNGVLADVGSDNNSLVSQQIRKSIKSSGFMSFEIPGDEFYNLDKDFLAPKGLVDKIAKSKKKNGGQLSPQTAKELTASVIKKYQYLNPEMMAILISEVPPAKEDK